MSENIPEQQISFLTLRKCIGIIALFLPFALYISVYILNDCTAPLNSISGYYHSDARNIFVGSLCAVSMTMYAYKGHDNDYILFRICSVLLILIAFFQTGFIKGELCSFDNSPKWMIAQLPEEDFWQNAFIWIHSSSAIIFFILISYIVYFRFTRSSHSELSTAKYRRNVIYKFCGVTMFVGLILTIVMGINGGDIFYPEWIILFCFGISWLVKGQLILKDPSV